MRRDGRRRFGRAFAVHLWKSIDKTIQASPTCTDLQQERAHVFCMAGSRLPAGLHNKQPANPLQMVTMGLIVLSYVHVMEGMLAIGNWPFTSC